LYNQLQDVGPVSRTKVNFLAMLRALPRNTYGHQSVSQGLGMQKRKKQKGMTARMQFLMCPAYVPAKKLLAS